MSPRIHRSAVAVDVDVDATPASAWSLHCDGSALPNPGRMGLGAVLLHPEGHRHALSAVAPGTGCNNEAELRALGLGLAEAKALGATELRVFSDNSVLVEQLGRRGQRPILRLARLIEAMRHELDALAWWRLEWIPRHRNREADALARAALGLAAGDRTKPKHRSGSARP